MSRTKINTYDIFGASSKAELARNVTNNAANDISSIRWGLDSRILQRNNISGRLNRVGSEVAGIGTYIDKINTTVNQGADLFSNADLLAQRNASLIGTTSSKDGSSGNKLKYEAQFAESSTSVSDGSVEEKKASNAYKSAGETNVKEVLFGKFGSYYENIAGVVEKGSFGNNFWATWKYEIGKYSFSNAETVGDKIQVGTKWAGVLLTGVTKAIGNYEEFGTVKSGRFWAETITETVVEIGITTAATAAVGAAAAALGVAAPAVAVGAIAAVAVWGVDTAVRAVTKKYGGEEKGLTETVSDAILDVGESAINAGKQFFSKIGNAFKNTGASGTKWCLSTSW